MRLQLSGLKTSTKTDLTQATGLKTVTIISSADRPPAGLGINNGRNQFMDNSETKLIMNLPVPIATAC
jgi:hypothetical protein